MSSTYIQLEDNNSNPALAISECGNFAIEIHYLFYGPSKPCYTVTEWSIPEDEEMEAEGWDEMNEWTADTFQEAYNIFLDCAKDANYSYGYCTSFEPDLAAMADYDNGDWSEEDE